MVYGPYETLRVTGPDNGILHVELNRPERLNALNQAFWDESVSLFADIHEDTATRVVVISAQGRAFTAGLDLSAFPDIANDDVGRRGYHVRRHVLKMQQSFNMI